MLVELPEVVARRLFSQVVAALYQAAVQNPLFVCFFSSLVQPLRAAPFGSSLVPPPRRAVGFLVPMLLEFIIAHLADLDTASSEQPVLLQLFYIAMQFVLNGAEEAAVKSLLKQVVMRSLRQLWTAQHWKWYLKLLLNFLQTFSHLRSIEMKDFALPIQSLLRRLSNMFFKCASPSLRSDVLRVIFCMKFSLLQPMILSFNIQGLSGPESLRRAGRR